MRVQWVVALILAFGAGCCWAQQEQSLPPRQLVREVVYNELHDHQNHGYWSYWVEQHSRADTRLEERIETAAGPVSRLILIDGRLLNAEALQQEQARIESLLSSPEKQARKRQEYADDEKRIGRIVALLPDAFLYDYAGEENGCYRLRFRPDPDYPAHSIEARIFHAMTGELWIDAGSKRLARLEGHLEQNVDFGFGILGRLDKGGWFRLQRTRTSATDWKTDQLEIHVSGRALLFKTIARETSRTRGGFAAVPPGMSLAQAIDILRPLPTNASAAPTSLAFRH